VSEDELSSGLDRDRAGISPWVLRIAGPVSVALVAVLAGPHLLSSGDATRRPPTVSRGPSVQAAPLVDAGTGTTDRWKPRGPDVGSDFAAAAMARMHVLHQEVDRLLWAGSLDGHDKVAVAAFRQHPESVGGIKVAALRVQDPSEIATAETVVVGDVSGPDGLVGVAWRGSDRHTRLLVVAPPAPLEVQVSAAVDYDRTGRISRHWQDAELADGVAVVDLGPRADPVVMVRPKDRGSPISPFQVGVRGRPAPPDDLGVRIAGVRSPSYGGPDPSLLVRYLAHSLASSLDLRDATARVLWSGAVPGGRREVSGPAGLPVLAPVVGRGALVVVRRLDGPVFQAFVYSDPDGGLVSAMANPVRWSVADRLPFAFSTYERAPLVLINPGGAGSATVVTRSAGTLRATFDGHGVATLDRDAVTGPNVSGARVVVADPSGRTVLRSMLVDPGTVDGFGLYL
jgi:hypothetical protein